MQTHILYWLGHALFLRPVPKQPTWDFHYVEKGFLQNSESHKDILPLCSDNLTT